MTRADLEELRTFSVHSGCIGLLVTVLFGSSMPMAPDLWVAFMFAALAGIGVLTLRGAWRTHRKASRLLKDTDNA